MHLGKEELLNTEIYNIGYDGLLTVMELCDILLQEEHEIEDAYTIIKVIRKIAIQSKLLMFNKDLEKRREADN